MKDISPKDMRRFQPNKVVAIAYMKHLENQQGKYCYQKTIFTGIAFESRPDNQVDAKVIQNGVIIGDYHPEIFASVPYDQQVDFSLKMPYEDMDPRKPEQALVYRDDLYTGVAYYFKDNPAGHLEAFENVLLLDGKEAAGLGWNVWGELGIFWYRGHLSSYYGIGKKYITCYLFWDFREKYLYCEPFAPQDQDALTDLDVTGVDITIYDKPANDPDRRVKLSIDFQRTVIGEISWISIDGDICLESELTPKNIPYWPFQNLDDLFTRWKGSESFDLGGGSIDDTMLRRIVQSGLLDTVKILSIGSAAVLTLESEEVLLLLPSLIGLSLTSNMLKQSKGKKLVQSLQSKRPNLKITFR